jgi:hypothetical protein
VKVILFCFFDHIVSVHFEFLNQSQRRGSSSLLNNGSYLEGDKNYYCAVKPAYYRTAKDQNFFPLQEVSF